MAINGSGDSINNNIKIKNNSSYHKGYAKNSGIFNTWIYNNDHIIGKSGEDDAEI